MRNIKSILALLALLFSVMMSLPFLVPHLGFLALAGFVPLLLMEAVADAHGVRRFFWWQYLAFVLWNAFTTFWVCNATVGGGIFAIVANAAQMSVIFAAYRYSRKRFSPVLSLIFLAVLWIAWERLYFDAQISWPWLVLGNAFARDIRCIQWYEYTGTLGGSLWIWASNISLFLILKALMQGDFQVLSAKARGVAAAAAAFIIAAPLIWSFHIWNSFEERSEGKMDVVIAQPDFDPYMKFQSLSQAQQDVILIDMLEKGLRSHRPGAPTLILAPETFTNDIVLGQVEEGYTWNRMRCFLEDYPDANLLFGASAHEFFTTPEAPSVLAWQLRDGRWVESRNTGVIMDRTGRTEMYHKSKLVVGVEMTPYPRFFTKIDDKLGHVMGRCIGQDEISLLNAVSYDGNGNVDRSIPLGCIICYESIYGEFCTGYVKAGAKALAVITNDAWWGNTPGYRQHLSYASLRAIETRRDIARCANTGISGFINQRGEISGESTWWEQEVLGGQVNLNSEETFFVRNGDIPGRICCFVALLLLALCLTRTVLITTQNNKR